MVKSFAEQAEKYAQIEAEIEKVRIEEQLKKQTHFTAQIDQGQLTMEDEENQRYQVAKT